MAPAWPRSSPQREESVILGGRTQVGASKPTCRPAPAAARLAAARRPVSRARGRCRGRPDRHCRRCLARQGAAGSAPPDLCLPIWELSFRRRFVSDRANCPTIGAPGGDRYAQAALLLATAVLAARPACAGVTVIESALLDYDNCHWLPAFESFVRLADAGDPVAARIATWMVRLGPTLYGRHFAASNARVTRWRDSAARSLDRDR
jgi:hypothetical protein